uniref:Uncharacterized protein n=1 Tax=Morchella brunnea TaxID=1174671 RepID=A0A8K1I8B9_9PEZI|nr:hypothetical protein LK370_mgp043 [Morchella brunnea]UBU98587.1 hypothetical protein [Morchella brunnea]
MRRRVWATIYLSLRGRERVDREKGGRGGGGGWLPSSAPYPGRVRVCAVAAGDSLIYFHPPSPAPSPLSNSLLSLSEREVFFLKKKWSRGGRGRRPPLHPTTTRVVVGRRGGGAPPEGGAPRTLKGNRGAPPETPDEKALRAALSLRERGFLFDFF